MSKIHVQGLAFVLSLMSLPLISIGATAGVGFLWGVGLALLAFGGLAMVAARYTPLLPGERRRRMSIMKRRGTRKKDV